MQSTEHVCVCVCVRERERERERELQLHWQKFLLAVLMSTCKFDSFPVLAFIFKSDLYIVESRSSMFAIFTGWPFNFMSSFWTIQSLVIICILCLVWVWRLLSSHSRFCFKHLLISTVFLVTVHYSTNSLPLLIRFITQSFWFLTLFNIDFFLYSTVHDVTNCILPHLMTQVAHSEAVLAGIKGGIVHYVWLSFLSCMKNLQSM